MNKKELRVFFKNYPVNEQQKTQEQEHLLQLLWALIQDHNPTCVGLYAAIEQEIDLNPIFHQCIKANISVAYPRITNDQLTFHEIISSTPTSRDPSYMTSRGTKRGIQSSLQNILIPGPFGIAEPPEAAPIVVPDLIVVPGLAFTKSGKRLGRGKGHYDKYLSTHHSHTVSVAFSWQVLADLPTEPHDITIQKIIHFSSLI